MFNFYNSNGDFDNKASISGPQNVISKQANINSNTIPDKDEMMKRRQDSEDESGKGTVILGAISKEDYNIIQYEPVFTKKEYLKGRIQQAPLVLSVINGINHHNYMTSDEMRNDYVFMGIAETTHDFTNVNEDKQGLATMKAGSTSIINNGNDELKAGDLISFAFPHFNKYNGDKLDMNWVKKSKLDKGKNNRLTAQVQKWYPGSTADLTERMFYTMVNFLKNPVKAKLAYPLNSNFDNKSKIGHSRITDPHTLYSLGAQLSLSNSFIVGLQSLLPKKVIEINTPQKLEEKDILNEMKRIIMNGGEIKGEKAEKFRERLSKLSEKTVDTHKPSDNMKFSGKYKYLEDGGTTISDYLSKLTKEEKEYQEESLKWLASALGMIGTTSDLNDKTSLYNLKRNWIEDFILTYYHSFIPSETLLNSQSYKPNFKNINIKTGRNASSQLARLLSMAPSIDTTTRIASSHAEFGRINGVVVKGGGPGKVIGIIINPKNE